MHLFDLYIDACLQRLKHEHDTDTKVKVIECNMHLFHVGIRHLFIQFEVSVLRRFFQYKLYPKG